jgi:hypothetical protein
MKTTDASTDAAPLVVQARTAYEQKRTKECVNLIRQVLSSDPKNAEALAIQEAVHSDIERDLVDARALLRDAQRGDGGQKYQKAAEIILLKILYLDPTHAEAKALLNTAKGSTEPSVSSTSAVNTIETPAARGEELMFTAAPVPFERQTAKKSSGLSGKLPIIIVAVLILTVGGVLFYGFSSKRASTATVDAKPTPAPVPEVPKPIASAPSAPVRTVQPVPTPTPPPDPKTAAANDVVAPPAEKPKGSLAVSSAIFAEIYMGGKSLGETPTTLQLPSGKQTLEYRHGNLKTVMTHDIKPNQTTTAIVTFELDLQINARPWAQVFVEGSTRKALGQTPLGSVRVPIGSVLTFENPNFPSKTYRVTDKDSTIQIVFP